MLVIEPCWNIGRRLKRRSVGLFRYFKDGVAFGAMNPIWATAFVQHHVNCGKRVELTGRQDDLDECFDEPAAPLSLEHHLEKVTRTRPPIRSRPSRIVTLAPFLVSISAALNPAIPAPTTQICGMRPWGSVLRIMSLEGESSSSELEMRLADVAELDFLLLLMLLLRLTRDVSMLSCFLRAAA